MNENVRVESNIPYFDKSTTNIIKGIALIMMFLHHFFTFPEWWQEGISYPLIEKMALYFREPLKMCVPVFCFITGYMYAFNKNKTYKYSLKKISDFLISYWCVFFLLAIVSICGAHYQYSLKFFLMECFAFYRPTMIFCWYVSFYITFMLLLPLITKIMTKNIHIDLIISFIIVQSVILVLYNFVSHGIAIELLGRIEGWFPCVLIGYIFAKYKLFEKMYSWNMHNIRRRWLNVLIWICLFCVIPMGRIWGPTASIDFKLIPTFYICMDAVYAPIFVYILVNLIKNIKMKYVYRVLFQIGKYSMLMWFLSCIFFNNSKSIFQSILYKPHNPIIVTLWGLFMCFVVAFFLDIVIKKLQKIKNKIFFSNL